MSQPSGMPWSTEALETRDRLNFEIWATARRLVEDSPLGKVSFPQFAEYPELNMMEATSSDYADHAGTGADKVAIEVEPLDDTNLDNIRVFRDHTIGGVQPREPMTFMSVGLVSVDAIDAEQTIRVARDYHLIEDGRLGLDIGLEPEGTQDYIVYEYPDIGLTGRRMLLSELVNIQRIE